ncbi:MAG: MFS transporter, partial [Burkholderiales bacterium]
MPGRFPALAHREFRRYFTGQAIALVGGFAHNVAMAWLAYRLTGSVAVLGVLGFAQAAPTFFVSPIAGLLADRYPRRRMLIGLLAAVALLGLVLAALTATGWVTPTVLVAVALLRGLAFAFEIPIRNAFLADIVPERASLPNAVALHSSALNTARFIGPAIGGLLIAAVGEAACFLLHPLTLTATLVQLLRIRTN